MFYSIFKFQHKSVISRLSYAVMTDGVTMNKQCSNIKIRKTWQTSVKTGRMINRIKKLNASKSYCILFVEKQCIIC